MEQHQKRLKCEVWNDVPGYEGYYQVSNMGKVRSVPRIIKIIWNGKEVLKPIKEREIALRKQNGGYLLANLSVGGHRKECTVHRLVARAFIPNPNNLKEVNHIDGNKQNNDVSNLEWCDRSDNLRHRARVLKQRGNAVKIRCVETGQVFDAIKDAAKWAGVTDSAIGAALKAGDGRKCGGYQWKRL